MAKRATSLQMFAVFVFLLAALTPSPSAQLNGWLSKLEPVLQQRAYLLAGESRIIVRAVDAASLAPVITLIQQLGGSVGRTLLIINGQAAIIPNVSLRSLASSSLVDHVSLDRLIVGAMGRTGPTVGATAVRDAYGDDGSGVGVAVIDSGITSWHDDLTDPSVGTERVDRFVDLVSGQQTPYDDYGHGTHVAGIIAGNGFDSSGARSGVAPAAHLMVLKVLDGSGHGHISNVI